MAQKRKSEIDKVLLEAEEIEKAFEANAKEILTRSMGSEIEEMVKESLEGSMALNEDDDDDSELEVSGMDIDADEDGEEIDLDLDLDDESDEDDNEVDLDLDLDVDDNEADLDVDDVETIDLTGAEDSDVITVFKKMGPEDEIEVVQDGDSVDIKDIETGAEYRVEFGGGDMDMDMDDMDMEMDMDDMEMDIDDMNIDIEDEDFDMDIDIEDEDEENDLELDIDMDDDEDDMMDEDMDYEDEDDIEEASRTLGSGKRWGKKGLDKPRSAPRHLRQESVKTDSKLIKENKVLKHKLKDIVSENEELKADYNTLVDSLKGFRTKLNEVAVFNSNLTYAVRLFTEHSTTKEEKVDIIKRFDEAKSLKESKLMYKQLVKEISKAKPIKESVEEKLNETKGSGSKTEISESKVYVHPELEKMKNLWEFNYKYK